MKMTSLRTHRGAARQRGSFLLEALISVLIVAFGVLGLIGLQARAIQNVDDAQYRGEAAYLANALIGQMWVSNQATLVADFDSGGAGIPYTEFKTWVGQRLPGASIALNAPVVTITARRDGHQRRRANHHILAAARGDRRGTNTTSTRPSERTDDHPFAVEARDRRKARALSRR